MNIWTKNYRPFIMGGDVNAPIMADVPVVGPFNIGKGYEAYLAISPSGKTFVVEATSGAIVGSTVEEVRKDVEAGDVAVIQEQVSDAIELAKRAYMTTPEALWKRLKAL